MSEHTPGPSEAQLGGFHDDVTVLYHDARDLALIAAAPDMLAALREIVNPGPVGYPSVLEYYHDMNTCECPSACAHCVMVNKARAILGRVL
jgi:hypothetical protein